MIGHVREMVAILVLAAATATMALQPPPVVDARSLKVKFKEVASRAAKGCAAAFAAGHNRVSIDIPPISSVDRGTTARKYEDDNNFLLAVIEQMGAGRSPERVGLDIDIKMGGFEKGGDYLGEEGLYGYRWSSRDAQTTAVGNAEIGSSSLRELGKLDDGNQMLLFNLGLDKLSFFDKLGMPSLDDVEVGYVLRRVGPGFVSRQYPEEHALWKVESGAGSGNLVLVGSQKGAYKPQDAEAAIRRG